METRAPAAVAAPPPAWGPRASAPPADEAVPSFAASITGPCNQLAYCAARRFAEGGGREFETLLLTAPPGCGKTHLLRALYGALLASRRHAAVLFVPADRFHQQFVCAVQRRLLDPFRRKYRTADVLLLDDVHRLATKPRTQDEFLHTFDALLHNGRRIVLASDRSPQEIDGLSRPLQVRLQSALGFRMEPPDPATRLVFLRARAAGRAVPDAALAWLAAQAATSFRDLARCLEALQAGNGDRAGAQCILEGIRRGGRDAITVDAIAREVGAALGVRPADLREGRRTRALVRGRELCFSLARALTPLTLEALGKAFGGRDHATVHTAVRRVEARRKEDREFDRRVRTIEASLRRDAPPPDPSRDAPSPGPLIRVTSTLPATPPPFAP